MPIDQGLGRSMDAVERVFAALVGMEGVDAERSGRKTKWLESCQGKLLLSVKRGDLFLEEFARNLSEMDVDQASVGADEERGG